MARVVSSMVGLFSTVLRMPRRAVGSIQTVSAVMQEVSAHSQETFRVSENNTKIVAEVDRLMEDLSSQAKQLEQAQTV